MHTRALNSLLVSELFGTLRLLHGSADRPPFEECQCHVCAAWWQQGLLHRAILFSTGICVWAGNSTPEGSMHRVAARAVRSALLICCVTHFEPNRACSARTLKARMRWTGLRP
jgi:hypothetical protein